MAFDRNVELRVDGFDVVHLRVSFTEHPQLIDPDEFRIEVRRRLELTPEGSVTWRVHTAEPGYRLEMTTWVAGATVALAGCFAGVMQSPLGHALKKAKSRSDVRACINQHGFSSAIMGLSCFYTSLGV